MNSLKTVLFPATVIHSIRQYPLFLLFPEINLIAPAEANDREPGTDPTDSFINSGLCQVDTPCPLGDNLSRFRHLVNDINSRKDDYVSQLSSLTLASMSSSHSSGEESERAIINEFLTPRDVDAEKAEENHQARLWQARLVLAIGEILDSQEEEIAKNLSMVDDDTSGLFGALKGEMDDFDQESPFAELSQLKTNIDAVHCGNIGKRLSAWSLLLNESALIDAELFITTSADVIDILSESYDKICGFTPASYQGLEIPALIAKTEKKAVAVVSKFKSSNKTLLDELSNTILTLSDGKEAKNTSWSDMVTIWKDQLEKSFPAENLGRLPITIYVYKGIELKTLLELDAKKESGKNTVVLHVGY